ncbi:hypothetical protein Q1695_006627 [Nippostrongylus brasiliensis]|nr:hypothetical protein Q1695_006627 [Nippostrongylus brasiliensis]
MPLTPLPPPPQVPFRKRSLSALSAILPPLPKVPRVDAQAPRQGGNEEESLEGTGLEDQQMPSIFQSGIITVCPVLLAVMMSLISLIPVRYELEFLPDKQLYDAWKGALRGVLGRALNDIHRYQKVGEALVPRRKQKEDH